MKQGVLVVLGHKGSGKTQLTRRFLEEVPRSICYDTIGEYGGVVIEDPYSLADYLENAKRLPRFRVSYRDAGASERVTPAMVFKMLHNMRDVWICLEEASKWGNANTMLPEARWFLQYGRHNRISVLLVARRPQELDRMATAQADTVVSFVQHEPRDLDYIRQLGGEQAEERIKRLGKYEWDFVVDQHAEIRRVLSRISEGGERVSDASGFHSADVGNGGDGARGRRDVAAEEIVEGAEGARDRAEGERSAGLVPESGVRSEVGAERGGSEAPQRVGRE